MNYLEIIITSVITSVASSGLIIYAAKTWISEKIKAYHDKRFATLKSNLDKAIKTHEIIFTNLQEKRANIIAETYALLKTVYMTLAEHVAIFEHGGMPTREERRKMAFEAHEAFASYYRRKLIFFPKKIAEHIESIDREMIRAFNEFDIYIEKTREINKNIDVEKWLKINNNVKNEIAIALSELESEFRKLLGDEGE